MDAVRGIASIGRYLGDPTRAAMLAALLDGRGWTAGELAKFSGVTPSTASAHLGKLVQGNLIAVERQGRHRYYRLANRQVAQAIESLTSLAMQTKSRLAHRQQGRDPLRYARSCYDHLAGELSINIVHSLVDKNVLQDTGTEFKLTGAGRVFFSEHLKIDVGELRRSRRSFARKCWDYSERKHHLAGSLGHAMFDSLIHQGWLIKDKKSRRLLIAAKGRRAFNSIFNIDVIAQ